MSKNVGVKFCCDRCKKELFISVEDIYGADWESPGWREFSNQALRKAKTDCNWTEVISKNEILLLCGKCHNEYRTMFEKFMVWNELNDK